jgi:hypothetical protein
LEKIPESKLPGALEQTKSGDATLFGHSTTNDAYPHELFTSQELPSLEPKYPAGHFLFFSKLERDSHTMEDGTEDALGDKEGLIDSRSSSNELDSDDELAHRDICSTCESNSIEDRVLEAVGYDLPRAAYLIPLLHAMSSKNGRFSPESWEKHNIVQCPSSGSDACNGDSGGNTPSDSSSDKSRQKRKVGGKDSDEPGDNEGHHERNDRNPKRNKVDFKRNNEKRVLFACPFNKRNPAKYNSRILCFKTCSGPGFSEFRLLK